MEQDITLQQAVLLNFIVETIKARGIVKVLGTEAFIEGAPYLLPEAISFNFNHYPHLWDDYEALPEKIKEIVDPSVTKLAPSKIT